MKYKNITRMAAGLVSLAILLPSDTAHARQKETDYSAQGKQNLASHQQQKEPDCFANVESITRAYAISDKKQLRYYYTDENGDKVSLRTTSSKKAALEDEASLPPAYDLRLQGAITPVKDQGYSGSCWAFATVKAMESSLLLQGLTDLQHTDLSENHLTWYTYHPSTSSGDVLRGEGATITSSRYNAYSLGGTSLFTQFTLARGSGAIDESLAPFSAASRQDITSMAQQMTNSPDSFRYRSDYQLMESNCYDDASQEQIKEAIINLGAMNVALFYEPAYETTTETGGTAYYQQLYPGETARDNANHCAAIIGWDDTYSKNNFGSFKPSSDGAWLIANSYGGSYGDGGYFWLSYEEPSLTEYYSFSARKGADYDQIYQYDGFGWGNLVAGRNTDSSTAANIFTTKKGYTQQINSVGIYTATNSQPYTISIYRHVSKNKPTSGTLAATVKGTAAFSGYHVIPLDKNVPLGSGERFSVVIAYDRINNKTGFIPIEGASARGDRISVNYTSNPGESFFYTYTGREWKWLDMNVNGSGNICNNICIKAFAKNTAAVGTIKLSESKVTLGSGEKFKPDATVSISKNKTVTYTSNHPEIASVNRKTGKITAKKVGTATITATLASNEKATMKVTVKKAPGSVSSKPNTEKKLKKGSSFQIKAKLPSGSASHSITYKSSKASVARVSDAGRVTAVKKGSTVITLRTYNGKKTKIRVVVK